MYEARQNKEKVSRRIDGGRTRQTVKVKRKFHPSIIQRVPFKEFVSNLQNNQDKNKTLYVYTHVLADGWGDIGMLNNFVSILSQYKLPLGIGDIKKIGTIQNNKDAENKKKQMENAGFEQVVIADTENGTPAIGTREAINVSNKEWEIQSPVPDSLSVIARYSNDPKFTALGEMGVDSKILISTTMKATDSKEEVTGLILPPKSEDKKYEGKIPGNLNEFLGVDEDRLRDPRDKLPKFAIINVRRKDKGEYRPSIETIKVWNQSANFGKIILLGKGEKEENKDNIQEKIFLADRFDVDFLHHIIKKMPKDGLVVAGGEGLFSEALGLGESKVAFGSRYDYQIDAMKHYANNKGLTNFEKELKSLEYLTSNGKSGDSTQVSSFDEFGKMSNLLRDSNVDDYIKRIIYIKRAFDIMKFSRSLFLRMLHNPDTKGSDQTQDDNDEGVT